MIELLLRYLKHYWLSTTIYNEHSPQLYRFWEEVIKKSSNKSLQPDVESIRKGLLKDQRIIERHDLGQGSKKTRKKVSIAQLARTSVSPKRKCALLFQVAGFTKADLILELGTSLGISSAYLAKGRPNSSIISVEGDPALVAVAQSVHKELKLSNINVVKGSFEVRLPEILKSTGKLDLVFIDGNHHSKALLTYIQQIIPHMSRDGILVIDDIFWSSDMMEGWKELCQKKWIKTTVLYHGIGFIFMGDIRPYELHLKWVDRWMKPWGIRHAI